MWRTTIRSIGAHKRRLLADLSAVGGACVGTLVLGDTMETGFGDMFDEANAGTGRDRPQQRRGRRRGRQRERPARRAGRRRRRRGRRRRHGRTRDLGIGQIVGSDGDPFGQRSHPGRELDRRSRDQPLADRRRPRPRGPGEVVVDKASADDGDLQVGDATTIRTPIRST